MAWGIVMTMCYLVAAMGLVLIGLTSEAEPVCAEPIDARELPARIPDVKKAA